MKKYLRKPVETYAIQWRGDNQDEVRRFVDYFTGAGGPEPVFHNPSSPIYPCMGVFVDRLAVTAIVPKKDWIVADTSASAVFVCTDEEFRQDYAPTEETPLGAGCRPVDKDRNRN